MILNKQFWTEEDGKEFQKYLLSLSKGEKSIAFEQKIANTKLSCIAVPSKQVQKIASAIAKGNFISFLNLWLWDNLTSTFIIGRLICRIKNFDTLKIYLDKYAEKVDNWASCDVLKFDVNKENQDNIFSLAEEYLTSPLPFKRRIGVIIFFDFLKNDEFIDRIFNNIKNLFNEEEYYVNMAVSWLLCEMFIKHKQKTIEFLKQNKVNAFTLAKTISKCQDSFRISKEDKSFLKTLKTR